MGKLTLFIVAMMLFIVAIVKVGYMVHQPTVWDGTYDCRPDSAYTTEVC